MPSKTSSPEFGGARDAFMEALEGYIGGLISLERLRLTTGLLLGENLDAAEEMQSTIDSALKEGHLDRTAHKALSTLIELETSEDEPTQSPRNSGTLLKLRPLPANARPPITDGAIGNNELTPGMILRDRFTLLEQIDSGSMGKIFKAVDRLKEESGADSPWVAIKSINEAISNPPNALVALQKEVANAQRLSHPNIIRVFDIDRDGEHVFMTMELLDGMSLTQLLNQHRFRPYPAEEAKSIIEGICRGLNYAHDLGIIHADVKPGNVFVTSDKRTKLLDFGISVSVTDDPDDSEVYAHTPSYASCEVLEGYAPTAQDDVYSMACVAYRTLTGRRAYDGETALAAESKKLELQPVENISPHEWAALRHALAFRRSERTADVVSFLKEFTAPASSCTATLDSDVAEPPRPATAFGVRSAGMLVATAAISVLAMLLWPKPEAPRLKPVNAEADTGPAVNRKIGPVGPPTALRASVDGEISAPVATPTPRKIDETALPFAEESKPIDKMAERAESSLEAGRLLAPQDASAKYFITAIQAIDMNAEVLVQLRRRFAELMMLEVMVAIANEDFAAAEQLIAETKSVGVDDAMTERYETSLMKARDDSIARKTEVLTSLFATPVPATGISERSDEYFPVAELLRAPDSATGSTVDIPTEPAFAAESTGESAGNQNNPAAPQLTETLPLSAFEFERHVQPKFPQHAAQRRLSGWVDLRFLVNAQGRTENIEVMDSSPKGNFEKAATRAIAKWRFKPMTADGVPVEKLSMVRLRFDAR